MDESLLTPLTINDQASDSPLRRKGTKNDNPGPIEDKDGPVASEKKFDYGRLQRFANERLVLIQSSASQQKAAVDPLRTNSGEATLNQDLQSHAIFVQSAMRKT